jgi:uncharacterized membrane protein
MRVKAWLKPCAMLAGASCYHSTDAAKVASGQRSSHACDEAAGWVTVAAGTRLSLDPKPLTLQPKRS